jgi:hypothetical protein
MDDKRLPKISSRTSQNHQWLKWGWHKDAKSWPNHWGIQEAIMHNIDNITNIITSKFKENMWSDKELVDQNYLSDLKSAKNKINIAKIRTNSHELHSEIGPWNSQNTMG